MNLREKLLMELAKNPAYEGKDETEKALVTELKKELGIASAAAAKAGEDDEVKAAAKELAGNLMEMVKTMVNETKGAPEHKPSGLTNEPDEEMKNLSKEEKFAKFVKALYKGDVNTVEKLNFAERTKALAEGTPADGGYLVPDDFRASLIEHMLQTQSFRQFATVIPMSGKLLNIPRLSSDVKVYWGTENRTITTTTADFGEIELTPFRLNAIIYTSRELFDDSAISIFDVLRRRFTDRVTDEEMKVFLNGDGTTQPKGVNQETFRSVSAANALTPDHLTKAYYLLPEGYRNTARWIINSRVMEHLENSKDSYGQYLYPSLQGEVKTLKGRPILVTDYQPSSKLTLGDLSYYYIGDRQQMTMDVTTEAGGTWEKFQVGLRCIERVDGEVALTQAFVQVTNTNIH
jgi:HK97 family phage major capsid protein